MIVPFSLVAMGCGGKDSTDGTPATSSGPSSAQPCAAYTPAPLNGWQGVYTETDKQCNGVITSAAIINTTTYEVLQFTVAPETSSLMIVSLPQPESVDDWPTRAEGTSFAGPLVNGEVATVPPGATLHAFSSTGVRLYIQVNSSSTARMIVTSGLANRLSNLLPKNPEQRARGILNNIVQCVNTVQGLASLASQQVSSYQFWADVSGSLTCKNVFDTLSSEDSAGSDTSKEIDAAASATKDFFTETLPEWGNLLHEVLLHH